MMELVWGLGQLMAGWLILVASTAPIVWWLSRQAQPIARPNVPPTWGGIEIILMFIGYLFITLLASQPARQLLDLPELPDGVPRSDAESNQISLITASLAFPFQLMFFSVLFRWRNPESRHAFGLFGSGIAHDILTGMRTWRWCTPMVIAAFGVPVLLGGLIQMKPDEHDLSTMAENASPGMLALIIIQAAIVAPIVEELAFRGAILRSIAQNEAGCDVVYASAIFLPVLGASIPETLPEIINRFGSSAFLILLMPWYLRIRRRHDVQTAAIWASSALFAALHASVWPSPIPLFVLAMVLGRVTLASGSLLPPILIHAMFNSVSIVQILILK
ncbi:CPBP family intramembrane glutamic endopeptidase [Tuwongella immobilis]|uniref:CAAX prenyl protease 2/Lysostaphin resistance protein A-like domain-containing protein n=1 Tax=Tuwongella immobilis TaxID=692036 RepID=A0A6C2YMJ9_9BACT|nr:CPBP family intramembrane glutamic endopeptidase [Tuwongella immobilis]VIP02594.1 abortive infection protein : Abortive infection protein OS=Isosphaera pallida (strain ATCC 43644 / DSM 9630 / IS1B) GN=Isop_0788 PE=4 SV=1: Abi [Tuwongella immobilis]VTS01870.1 abortive infection protein : Abortive infection protein OS=Isosphaera pallida (strain ATCC 43644 / DSM 9630 / IS1B) GN=Isop_0788 PE=4 SV=1: Abi [Tuwongella immobilis]